MTGWFCPACGALMYPARLLKGYDKTGDDADRPTCALHGPLGRFRHIATDRAAQDAPTNRTRRVRMTDKHEGSDSSPASTPPEEQELPGSVCKICDGPLQLDEDGLLPHPDLCFDCFERGRF